MKTKVIFILKFLHYHLIVTVAFCDIAHILYENPVAKIIKQAFYQTVR